MHIVVATDADWVVDELRAALEEPGTTFTLCTDGRHVAPTVAGRTPDLAILDLQVGSMGGMAVAMALRLDESAGTGPHVPILMLLDRSADIHLAKRSGVDGWVIKPLDAMRLRKAARLVTEGGSFFEGVPHPADQVTHDPQDADMTSDPSAEDETVTTG
ncbi:MAG: response regulator transcription factor [Microthrixaceae bacterium]|nr:response regulator transcription factor [Microthrixaceae bacterium]MCB1040836.1 response regulator transcription factor [Acidimicrobiales bacterium]